MTTPVSRLGELCFDHVMATSSANTSTSRKKQMEERNLRLLRELGALMHNKQCFDCHQRGPTYVNMTIGSFVCTKCSGLLRGLNPPHRVKSISMAMFAPDEIEFLKARGNDYCRKVWAGRYTGTRGAFDDGAISKDEIQTKDYLGLKYEKKRWYVSPAEAFANNNSSDKSSPLTKPKTPLPPTITTFFPQIKSDLFLRQSDVVSKAKPKIAMQQPTTFFDTFDDDFATIAFPNASEQQDLFQQQIVNLPKSATEPAGFGVQHSTVLNGNQNTPSIVNSEQSQPKLGSVPSGGLLGEVASATDKYSALAELDELFHVSSSPPVMESTKNAYVDARASKAPQQIFQQSVSTSYAPYALNNFYPTSQPSFGQTTTPRSNANPFFNEMSQQQQSFFVGAVYATNGNAAGFGQQVHRNAVQHNFGGGFPISQYTQSNVNAGMNPFAVITWRPTNAMRPAAASQWNPFL